MPRIKTELMPQPTISKQKAEKLDAEINAKIKEDSDSRVRAYLQLATSLKDMRDSNGYIHLGSETWEKYLATKQEFGRTYLSYIYKLSLAGDLQKFVDQGISASKLIAYAKHADQPESIPQLIEDTWAEVKDLSVRKAGKVLKQRTEKTTQSLSSEAQSFNPESKKKNWAKRFQNQFNKLSDEAEQEEYIKQMKAFLKAQR